MRVEVAVLGPPVPNSPYGPCGPYQSKLRNLNCSISELRRCVRVEEDVLGSPSLIVRTVSVDVEEH